MKAILSPGTCGNINIIFENGETGYIPAFIVKAITGQNELVDIPVCRHNYRTIFSGNPSFVENDGHVFMSTDVPCECLTDEVIKLLHNK